jgi:hypothetical protein
MLLLLFTSATGTLYALDARDIIRIIPAIAIEPPQTEHKAYPYLLGTLSYLQKKIPAIEITQLIEQIAPPPSPVKLSTRLILLSTTSPNIPLALLAYNVLEIYWPPSTSIAHPDSSSPYSSLSFETPLGRAALLELGSINLPHEIIYS